MIQWGTMSRAAREAAYDNRNSVPDSMARMAALDAAAGSLRAAAAATMDQPYGPHPRNKTDFYPGQPGAPCFVFIHGGYWQRNGREGVAPLLDGLRAHGWSAAAPGYTLAPDASLTEITAEIGAALDWIGTHATGPLVLSGWSAGGHLTAMALGHPRVHAGLAISGVFELGPLRETSLNDALRLTDEEIERLSPLRLPAGPKPLAIAYGTAELPPFVADARALHAHRAAAHCPGPLIPVAGAHHFTVVDSLRQPAGLLTRAALALV